MTTSTIGVGIKVTLVPTSGKPASSKHPHEEWANVTDDDTAVKAFVRRWGQLDDWDVARGPDPPFLVLHPILLYRNVLRKAWEGDERALNEIQDEVRKLSFFDCQFFGQGKLLASCGLWTTTCILFLQDYEAGKIAICKNEKSCHSPYFVKSRRTQKYCSDGWCTLEAKRFASRKSWNKSGKKKREEARKKTQNRRRKVQ